VKELRGIAFNPHVCRQELGELGAMLDLKAELSERQDILPFFRKNVASARSWIGSGSWTTAADRRSSCSDLDPHLSGTTPCW